MSALKTAKFGRKAHMLEEVATGKMTEFKSINAAKRESVKLQLANDGALGRGSVRRHS